MIRKFRNLALAALAVTTIGTVSAGADCALELVGTVPVASTKVATIGTVAVVASGQDKATLIDMSGAIPLVGAVIDAAYPVRALAAAEVTVVVDDGSGNPTQAVRQMAYLVEVNGTAGLVEAFDITDPAVPTLAGSHALLGPPTSALIRSVTVGANSTAYLYAGEVAGDSGLLEILRLDAASAAPVEKVATYGTVSGQPGSPTGIVAMGHTGVTLALALGSAGIELVDVSSPSSPTRLSHFSVPGGAFDIASSGDAFYFFIASGTAGWHVLNFADSSAPIIVSTVVPPAGYAFGSITAGADHVMVGAGENGFLIYAYKTGQPPSFVSSGDTTGTIGALLFARGIGGTALLLIADGSGGFTIRDITYCLCTRATGSDSKKSIRMGIADRMIYSIDGEGRLNVIEVHRTSKIPIAQGSVALSMRPVAVAGAYPLKYAFAVGSTTTGVGRIDIVNANDKTTPTLAATLDLDFTPTSIVSSRGVLYVGGRRSSRGILRAYNLQTPVAPQVLGELLLSDQGTSAIRDLAVSDAFVLVAAEGVGLQIVDSLDASRMRTIGTYPTSGIPIAVAGYGSTAYVSIQGVGVEVIDMFDPTSPARMTAIPTLPAPTRLTAFFGRVGLAMGTAGLSLFDSFNPADISLIENVDTVGSVADIGLVQISAGTLIMLVADQDGGLLAFDISNCIASALAPIAGFIVSPDPPVSGQLATFTDNSRNTPTSWVWSFGDGEGSTSQNPQHTFNSAGVYEITLTASNIAGSSTVRRWVFVGGSTGNPAIGYSNVWYIPASAQAGGANNTFWSTDLSILNRSASPSRVFLSFLPANRDNHANVPTSLVTVPGNSSVSLKKVVESAFGQSSAAGGIQIAGDHSAILSTSRTFNSGGGSGTYGQGIPAEPATGGLGLGQTGLLIGLSSTASTTSGFRTNIGFLNASTTQSKVQVVLRRGDGSLAGAPQVYTLAPFEYRQITKIFEAFGAPEVEDGRAEVQVTEGTGRVFAYSSLIDNLSGDPVYQAVVK
jgi:hypothetical protein